MTSYLPQNKFLFWYITTSIIPLITVAELPWSYDTIGMWADLSDSSLFTEYQAKFIAENYQMVSLEKGIGKDTKMSTEEAFYNISAQIRKYGNETKLLMYFAVDCAYCKDYDILDGFCTNKSMWMTDDSGNYIYIGNNPDNPLFDHTQQNVRDFWSNAASSIMKTAINNKQILVNGIFGDGITKNLSTRYNISVERSQQWMDGVKLLMNDTKKLFTEINDDLYIIGNAISTYSSSAPDYGSWILPYIDGVSHMHFGSYEGVIGGNKGNGALNTDLILWVFNFSQSIANGDYGPNKALWIKGWTGPVGSPIVGKGAVHGPTWPIGYGITPNTTTQIQHASAKLITYPLAIYLCGIYHKYTYFGYGWFWNILQGWIPCPNDPTSCDSPTDWYKEFTTKLGKPKSNGVITDTFKCNRSFQYANVYVDIRNNNSAIIHWQ